MTIKALFLDLDGTLLTSAKAISPTTLGALRQCRQSGIKVFVATARGSTVPRQLRLTPEEAEVLADGGIFHNGGCVCFGSSRYYTTMQQSSAERALEIVLSHPKTNLSIQLPGDRHSFRHELPTETYELWGIDRDNLVAFEGLTYDEVVKIVVFSPAELLPGMYSRLVAADDVEANVYLSGGDDFRSIDIVARAVNKKLAIDRLIELCGLRPDEVAVFGDSHNDVEMLAGFEHSVAMGNGCAEAKAAARYIAPANDEDGICYALREVFGLI